ncbi:hypothetical protein ATANTOWER_018732 [Ataeniobius toweri]|uniref:Uncharacterized protein n=1 Tax=Ataeniobius toweri TaxID=208326 RepID=A0ABU7A806_9TELE|nr:hypothetical protein [Ataeniobius toweri]
MRLPSSCMRIGPIQTQNVTGCNDILLVVQLRRNCMNAVAAELKGFPRGRSGSVQQKGRAQAEVCRLLKRRLVGERGPCSGQGLSKKSSAFQALCLSKDPVSS